VLRDAARGIYLRLLHAVPRLAAATVHTSPEDGDGIDHHAALAHRGDGMPHHHHPS